MALAMIYPEPEESGRGKWCENGSENLQFSRQRLLQARKLLRHSHALAEDVLADRISLDAALKQMQEEQERRASAARC